MGKSGKRKGYRPRSQRQQAQDAARSAALAAADGRRRAKNRHLLIACAVLLSLALAFGIASLVGHCSGSVALSTPHCRVDGEMLTYYFYDYYIAELAEHRAEYVAAGLDPAQPLDGQMYNASMTWEAHFLAEVKASLRRMLVFAETAYRENSVDMAAARAAADRCMTAMQAAAEEAGTTLAVYLADCYGVDEDAVRRAEELSAIADARYRTFAEKIYTAEERRERYEQNPAAYQVADVIAYSVKVDLTGVSGEDAMRAEYLRAENRAKQIAAATDEAAFLAAIEADLRREKPSLSERGIATHLDAAYLYHIPYAAQGLAETWVNEVGRLAGDTAVLGETGDYTVVYCLAAPRRVESCRVSAQYILVPYADHMTEALAQAAADDILASFLEDEPSSERFADLVARYGTTTDSLFSAVTNGDVEKPLGDWLLADAREVGDTAVLAASDGYYILYYTARSPLPLWEEMVADSLREEDYRLLLAESGVTVHEKACVVPAIVPAI
ncbi:MAG: hypothetical protein IJY20_00720 [Clostridia bacterium]|nr:hypothetical protein [Clostridia bacterium]